MRNVFIVTAEQNDLARHIESLLLGLPPASGILFVGARIHEVITEDRYRFTWELEVAIGCGRNLEVGVVEALVWEVISKDPLLKVQKDHIKLHVRRGVARSLREGVDTST